MKVGTMSGTYRTGAEMGEDVWPGGLLRCLRSLPSLPGAQLSCEAWHRKPWRADPTLPPPPRATSQPHPALTCSIVSPSSSCAQAVPFLPPGPSPLLPASPSYKPHRGPFCPHKEPTQNPQDIVTVCLVEGQLISLCLPPPTWFSVVAQ
jgi:hypothetical protein